MKKKNFTPLNDRLYTCIPSKDNYQMYVGTTMVLITAVKKKIKYFLFENIFK